MLDGRVKKIIAFLKEKLTDETEASREMLKTYSDYLKGEASDEELEKANQQLNEILKDLSLGLMAVIPLAPITTGKLPLIRYSPANNLLNCQRINASYCGFKLVVIKLLRQSIEAPNFFKSVIALSGKCLVHSSGFENFLIKVSLNPICFKALICVFKLFELPSHRKELFEDKLDFKVL